MSSLVSRLLRFSFKTFKIVGQQLHLPISLRLFFPYISYILLLFPFCLQTFNLCLIFEIAFELLRSSLQPGSCSHSLQWQWQWIKLCSNHCQIVVEKRQIMDIFWIFFDYYLIICQWLKVLTSDNHLFFDELQGGTGPLAAAAFVPNCQSLSLSLWPWAVWPPNCDPQQPEWSKSLKYWAISNSSCWLYYIEKSQACTMTLPSCLCNYDGSNFAIFAYAFTIV